LPKVYFNFIFFFGGFVQKSMYYGVEFFSPDLSQKTNGTPYPSFFDIFTSFGIKNICTLFHEID